MSALSAALEDEEEFSKTTTPEINTIINAPTVFAPAKSPPQFEVRIPISYESDKTPYVPIKRPIDKSGPIWQIVEKFIELWTGLPEQGSAEWKKAKETGFGGSELSTLFHIYPFQTFDEAMQVKAKNKAPKELDMSFMLWGNFTEQIHRDLIAGIFNTDIYVTGSIPYKRPGFKYSPDGIGVVRLLDLIRVFGQDNIKLTTPEVIVLFEFKSLTRRSSEGEIPTYYFPQVQAGMSVIPICQITIYSELRMRRCRLFDHNLNSTGYTTGFQTRYVYYGPPIIIGCSYVYATLSARKKIIAISKALDEQELDKLLSDEKSEAALAGENEFTRKTRREQEIFATLTEEDVDNSIIDIGAWRDQDFFRVIEEWRDDNKHAELEILNHFGPKIDVPKDFGNKKLIAIIPWKVFELFVQPIYPIANFLEICWPLVQESIDTLKRCQTIKVGGQASDNRTMQSVEDVCYERAKIINQANNKTKQQAKEIMQKINMVVKSHR